MTNEQLIHNYLEEQVKVDSALAEKYDAKMIPNLMKAITEKARKIAVNGAAMIQRETVYKWARDFFIDSEFEAVQADNQITEKTDVSKIKGVTAGNIDVEAIKAQAKAEALKQFKEEAKALAEAAAAKKAAEKAEREAEKARKAAQIEAANQTTLSLF